MNKRFWKDIVLRLVSIGLVLSACHPRPLKVVPSLTPLPTMPLPTVTSIPSPTQRLPTATIIPLTTQTPDVKSKIRWTFQTKGAIWGTATILDGVIYFGSDDRNLYALEAQTGKLKWKFTTQGLVRSCPAIAGGSVYFTSDDGYLYAVDLQNGKQTWQVDIGNVYSLEEREHLGNSPSPLGYDYLQSSPTVVDGQVYAGSADGNVYALAADTGKINWTFKTGAKVRATPTVVNEVVYIGSWDKSVYALDASNGQLRWATLIGGQVQTTAFVTGDLVYTASRKASVVALNTDTGEIKWEFSYGNNMWVESSPILVNGVIYIGSSGNKTLYGLDSLSGELVTAFFPEAFCWSKPAVVGETLYIGCTNYHSAENGLFAIAITHSGTGNKLRLSETWRLPIVETLEPSDDWSGVASSPVAQDGTIYFGGLDGKLYAVSD